MKFLMVLVLVLTSGCYSISTTAGPQRYIMLQVGVVAHVVNNCAPFLDVERPGGGVVESVPYGSSVTIPLTSRPFGGASRSVPLVVKGRTATGEYLGSQAKTFYVNTYQGTHEEVWEISYLQLPNGRGGCV